MSKLYCEMTRGEQEKYRTEVCARWIKSGMTFAIVLIPRKVRNSDGWYWTSDWCWKDSEGDMKPIDKGLLYSILGIVEKSTDPYLAHNLEANGYDIMDLDNVIVFNPKKYKKTVTFK